MEINMPQYMTTGTPAEKQYAALHFSSPGTGVFGQRLFASSMGITCVNSTTDGR
jgi:hypothetical protein